MKIKTKVRAGRGCDGTPIPVPPPGGPRYQIP